MSLVQRVSSIDGIDCEPERHGDVTNLIDVPSSGNAAPVQYEISYDVLPQPNITRAKAASPAYKVSAVKRLGKQLMDGCSVAHAFQKLTHLSPGNSGPPFLLDRGRCCIRLRCTETCHDR